MDRQEHLEWCKRRARVYLDAGDPYQAFASMISDLDKHHETENHLAAQIGMSMLLAGQLGTVEEMRRFIEGFN